MITSPADSTPANVTLNVAVPVASVVTLPEPMKVVPAASLKKFSVYVELRPRWSVPLIVMVPLELTADVRHGRSPAT